jgi:hypothetical protein
MVDDWVAHTPKSVLAKNFGLNASVFDTVPTPDPYILNSTVSTHNVTGGPGPLTGNSSYVYHTSQHPTVPVPGGGGTLRIIDSRNFPIATTIAATVVTLKPKALRELHWHPNVSSHQTLAEQSLTRLFSNRHKSGSISTKGMHVRRCSSVEPQLAHLISHLATLPHSRTTAVRISVLFFLEPELIHSL